jgi:hypothetical protein
VLGDPIVGAGTTSIHAGTAPLDVGDVAGPGFTPFPGNVHELRVVDGDPVTGTEVANPVLADVDEGATSFTDGAGRVWSVQGDAQVDRRKTVIVGSTTELRPEAPHGDIDGLAHVNIVVSGELRRLGQNDPPLQSCMTRLIGSPKNEPHVIAHWPMEDGRDATEATSPTPGVEPMGNLVTPSVRGLQFASDDSFLGSKPLPTVPSGQRAHYHGRIPVVAAGDWALDWLVNIPTPPDPGIETNLLIAGSSGTVKKWRINVTDSVVGISGLNAAGGFVFLSSFPTDERFYTTSLLHLDVVQNGGNVEWRVNWVPIPLGLAFGAGSAVGGSGSFAGNVGRPSYWANIVTGPPDGITFGHHVVTRNRPLGWLAPADTGFQGEPDTNRVARLSGEEGLLAIVDGPQGGTSIPSWASTIARGATAMGPQTTDTLPALLQECAESSLSRFDQQRHQPGIYYRHRTRLYNQTPVTIDAGAPGFEQMEPTKDDSGRVNDMTVTRIDGSSARDADPGVDTGQVRRRPDQVTISLYSDSQLPDQAAWRRHLESWDQMRWPTLALNLLDLPDEAVDQILELGPGERVRVTGLGDIWPPGGVDVLHQQITHSIGGAEWRAKVVGASAGPWDVGVWADIDDPDVSLGRYAAVDATLDSGIDDDDTGFDVAGEVWIDSAGHPDEFPFAAVFDGEKVTVTAISGTSSPQTWTVVRSVNGIVKSHSAGTPVQAVTFRWAL